MLTISVVFSYVIFCIIPCHTHSWGLTSSVAVCVRGHTPLIYIVTCIFINNTDSFLWVEHYYDVKCTKISLEMHSIAMCNDFDNFDQKLKNYFCIN